MNTFSMQTMAFAVQLGLAMLSCCVWAADPQVIPPAPPVAPSSSDVDPGGAAPSSDKAEPPIPFPELAHYAKLWETSLLTTRELPPPDVPEGPGFAEHLTLAGLYEIDGAQVAVVWDKMTSQVFEVRMGSDNEAGMRIRQITEGVSPDKTKVQLQKGDKFGWIDFAEVAESAPTQAPGAGAAGMATRQSGGVGSSQMGGAPQGARRMMAPPPAPVQSAPASVPMNSASPVMPADVPLPPSDVPMPPQ